MQRGSITVFLAMTLLLVMSFVFSLLEGARVACLRGRADTLTKVQVQSLLGSYDAALWENYHLLLLNVGEQLAGSDSASQTELQMTALEGILMEELGQTLDPGSLGGLEILGKPWDLVKLEPVNAAIRRYQLVTDQQGKAFQSQVSHQMPLEAAADVLEELRTAQNQGKDLEKEKEESQDQWNQAWDAVDQAQEIQEIQEQEAQETSEAEEPEDLAESTGVAPEEVLENPMDYVKGLQRNAMLSLVLEDPSSLSSQELSRAEGLGQRQLPSGNWTSVQEGAMDRIWLQYFIQEYFSNCCEKSDQGPGETKLKYEMEYLIGGKDSDSENLELVVYELLAIRQVMNFVTIMGDSSKKELALAIATAAVGFTGLLPLVKAVQVGILLAWAFVESILDIRTLLQGEKIPFLKNKDQWASDLSNCRNSVESSQKSKEDSKGLSYSQYLQMLLFLQSEERLSYRCMDLMGENLGLPMECMVQGVEVVVDYQSQPLFWNLSVLRTGGWETFSFPTIHNISYVGT